jgi:Cytochrome c7 and related cytochrome c/Class III cytochrome C family
MRRPLGCMTFSALVAAILTLLAIAGVIGVSGHSMFSPGDLSTVSQADVTQVATLGGVSSHAALEGRCDACHAAIWSGQTMGDRCLACHVTVGQQAATGTGLHGRLDATAATCLRCHTEHRGATASSTLAGPEIFPHDGIGFALTAHQQPAVAVTVGCRQCHPASPTGYTSTTCIGCHQRLDGALMAEHVDQYGDVCLNCHDGKDTYGKAFAHTSYPLVGKHESATCASCHARSTTLAALRSTSTECATCHVKDDIHQGRLGPSCGSCHTPAGWEGAALDHVTQTRFPLTGRHVGVACEACHTDRRWTGIGTTCAACHAADDPHEGQFTGDCATCHVAGGWNDVTFDHAATSFPLARAHVGVACASCHVGGKFVGTPTTCVACHAADDAHKGTLGRDCESCHQATTWSDASFDHNTTTFELTGAHTGVSCRRCHTVAPPASTSTSCASCHDKPAAHDRNFAGNCGTCHSTRAWRPAAFDHATTQYKLTGSHLGVACQKCHTSPATYSDAPTSCAACHTKPASHTGAFGSACQSCHSTKRWLPATFDHDRTGFRLTGAHLGISCGKCHKSSTFTGLSKACVSCHSKPASHPSSYGTVCTLCHTTRAWLPISYSGPHTFPMTHRGADGKCSTCHPSSLSSYTCSKCHSDAKMNEHHKEVSGYSLTTCAKCHPTGRND